MKKFSFRLDRVLQLRVAAEQDRARVLAEARAAEAERRAALEACDRRLAEAVEQVAALRAGPSEAGTLGNLHLPMQAANAALTAEAQRHAEAAARLETALAEYAEARQARMAIERLKEQRHAAWLKDVDRLEQAGLDEVALRISGAERTA